MTTERQLTTEIMRALKSRGGFWIKIAGSPSQVTGMPDIIGCYRGRFVGLEVKLPERVIVSKRQRLMLKRIDLSDGASGVVTSALAALAVLDEIDNMLNGD